MVNETKEYNITTRQGFADAAADVSRLLFTVSFSMLHHQDRCADAVQNALLKAWEKRSSLREGSKFKGWIVKIVMNECRKILKDQPTYPLVDNIPAEQFGHDVRLDIANAVFRLAPKYRVPVAMFYFEDMPVSDIAVVLNVPKGTIVSQLSRAREQLRKELSDYEV